MAPSSTSHSPAQAKMIHDQVVRGEHSSEYYAYIVAGVILTFAAIHWLRCLARRWRLQKTKAGRPLLVLIRPITKFLYGRQMYGLNVIPEKVFLLVAYFGINIGLALWQIDWSHYTTFANRLGWLALCNMILAVLLALKNTPLSPLAGRSYESLNAIHRSCGYLTIALMVLHSCAYAAGLMGSGARSVLMTAGTYGADVAGVTMLLIVATANGYVRRRNYEFFYVAHITLISITFIAVCFHTSRAAAQAFTMACVMTGLWLLDRSLRLSRWLYYAPGNYATLTPLPQKATRVTLRRPMRGAPGSHAFLYIPGVRRFQTHPFTMMSQQPVEFVISARDGFTKALYDSACKRPGRMMRVGIEGPYGAVPDVHDYDHVVLFAGGSGATFSFALALEWARKARPATDQRTLEFVWSIRSSVQLNGFRAELAELGACPRMSVRVHITKSSAAASPCSPGIETPVEAKQSIVVEELDKEIASLEKEVHIEKISIEKKESVVTESAEVLPRSAVYGRPNVMEIVSRVVESSLESSQVLVAACGPAGLSNDARSAVASCTKKGAPSIKLHLETFGW